MLNYGTYIIRFIPKKAWIVGLKSVCGVQDSNDGKILIELLGEEKNRPLCYIRYNSKR